MIKNKVKYIIVTIIIIIIGIIVFTNLFKSNKVENCCGDNAFFEYDKDTHTVTITGIGIVDLTKEPHYLNENMIDRGHGGIG